MSAEPIQPLSDLVPAPRPCPGLHRTAAALLLLGAILCLAAMFSEAHRIRLGHAYLWAFAFVWAVALGGLFFVGLQHLVRAVWSVVVRRVAEMLASSIWLVALLFLPVLVYCFSRGELLSIPGSM